MTSTSGFLERTNAFASPTYMAAFWQLGNTLALYAAAIGLMFYLLPVSYGYVLLLSLVAAIAHVRLFMIGHDCAHYSYLPKKWQNTIAGNLVGVLTNTPLHYWRSQHIKHHRSVGNIDKRGAGDVVTWTVEEYKQASSLEKLWYRINRNPWVLMFLFAQIHFLVLQRLPLEQRKSNRKVWRSVMGTNIGMLVYYGLLVMVFGLKAVLLVYLPVIWLSSTIAVWLFYIQHQYDTTYWERDANWSYEEATLKASSLYNLPRWAHWMTGNIGYHHIHHLNPRIPNYRLADCYESNDVFHDVRAIGFLESFRMATLSVWDEEKSRLVSFKTLA